VDEVVFMVSGRIRAIRLEFHRNTMNYIGI
jgi:hypothetical protein